MKLKIRDEFFREIKEGKKTTDYRDAHITFINEDTEEQLVRQVMSVAIVKRKDLYKRFPKMKDSGVLEDDKIIAFSMCD